MTAVLGLVGLEPILAQAMTGWQAVGGYLPPEADTRARRRVLELEFTAGDGDPLHVRITNARVACTAAGGAILTLPWCET